MREKRFKEPLFETGEFRGSTGVRILSAAELGSGSQAWAKRVSWQFQFVKLPAGFDSWVNEKESISVSSAQFYFESLGGFSVMSNVFEGLLFSIIVITYSFSPDNNILINLKLKNWKANLNAIYCCSTCRTQPCHPLFIVVGKAGIAENLLQIFKTLAPGLLSCDIEASIGIWIIYFPWCYFL